MGHEQRIKTPWRVQWVRFRSQAVPALTLTLCVALTVWLWSRHVGAGNAVGAVEVVRASITSDTDGILVQLPGGQVQQYQRVEEGQVIAKIDDAPLQRQRDAVQFEADNLRRQRAEATAPGETASPDLLDALDRAIAGKDEQLAQIDLKLQSMEIRSPLTGTVLTVFRRPGQFVQPGTSILELAADEGAVIISFIRSDQRIQPQPGMSVEVRPNSTPPRIFNSQVTDVGGQVDSVPSRLLRDPRTPEWGLPVRLTVPPEANLRPGEVVNLVFKTTGPGA